MVSLFGYSDPNTRDVARLEKSVKKKNEPLGECFQLFESRATSQFNSDLFAT